MKKFILSCLIFILVAFSFAPTAYAQQTGTWYNQSFPEWFSKVYGSPENEIFGERYTAAQVQWIFYSLISQVFLISQQISTCVFSGELTACFSQQSSSAQPNIVREPDNKNLLQAIFKDRPLSGVTYTKNVLRKFHLIPVASAQEGGFGFQRLDPILPLWRTSRNFAFGLFVLVIVILSFMIMFRVKISPQTVISVQSALPKIAIALILVTFSYAIAGFLVDLMYVFIGIISLFFNPSSPVPTFNLLTNGPDFSAFGGPTNSGIFGYFFGYLIVFVIATIVVFFGTTGVVGTLGAVGVAVIGLIAASALSGGSIAVVAALIGALLMLILVLVLIWQFFKVLWLFVKTFANILLLTILAPFQITFGVLVQSFGFGSWVKSIISNLAVFPIVGFMLMIAMEFLMIAIQQAFNQIANASTFIGAIAGILIGSPGIGLVENTPSTSWPPFLAGNVFLPLVFLGASFVIFTLIPKAADLIKSLVEGKPFAYGTAVGEAFGGVGLAYGLTAGPTIRNLREQYSAYQTWRLMERLIGRRAKTSEVLGQFLGGLKRRATGGS